GTAVTELWAAYLALGQAMGTAPRPGAPEPAEEALRDAISAAVVDEMDATRAAHAPEPMVEATMEFRLLWQLMLIAYQDFHDENIVRYSQRDDGRTVRVWRDYEISLKAALADPGPVTERWRSLLKHARDQHERMTAPHREAGERFADELL